MKDKLSVVFFGTHYFAKEILQSLIEAEDFSVDLVITKPDRKVGRKQKVQKTPVKRLAQKHKLAIDQPKNLKNYELNPNTVDVGVTAQYGKIIPKHILNSPKNGIINVHTSLLPKYRGASPIQTALLNGESKTGVTIMKMDEGMDTGPILLQKTIEIAATDTYNNLSKKLAELGSSALLDAIPKYISGEIKPRPQDDTKATITEKITRERGEIDWNKSAEDIYNKYRAFTPWPGIWTTWNGERLKLKQIIKADRGIEPGKAQIKNGSLYIGTKNKSIEVTKIQLEGKQEMEIQDFINGYGDRINNTHLK